MRGTKEKLNTLNFWGEPKFLGLKFKLEFKQMWGEPNFVYHSERSRYWMNPIYSILSLARPPTQVQIQISSSPSQRWIWKCLGPKTLMESTGKYVA